MYSDLGKRGVGRNSSKEPDDFFQKAFFYQQKSVQKKMKVFEVCRKESVSTSQSKSLADDF